MNTVPDFESPEEIRDTASSREAFYFLGQKLEPFSLGRQLAIQRIRTTNSELENALMVVFLCTLTGDEIDRLTRDSEGKAEFRRRMETWGEQNAIGIGAVVIDGVLQYASENTRRLVETAERIWAETDASQFRPKAPSGPVADDPNASGRDSLPST